MANNALAIYAHHHGSGHITRSLQIAQHINSPVFLLSSAEPTVALPKNVTFIQLPSDTVPVHNQKDELYLYNPWSANVIERYVYLANIFKEHNIRNIYVDVSQEVVHFSKLLGLNVGSAVMHGKRDDLAHTYGYTVADYLLAHMAPHYDEPTNRALKELPFYCGGIGKFKTEPIKKPKEINKILIIASRASNGFSNRDIEALASVTNIELHVAGSMQGTDLPNLTFHGVLDDYESLLTDSDAVIGTAGNNLIMEVASKGKPFICIPEDRPFDEQKIAARKLESMNAAIVLESFPSTSIWESLHNSLLKLNLNSLQSIVDDKAAKKAADFIMSQ